MHVEFMDYVEFVKAIMWPLVSLVAILAFRKPLSRFLEGLSSRITKLSVAEVSLELAKLPAAPVPWADPTVFGGDGLPGGAVTSTTIMELFQRIRDDATWQYMIVDIKTGRRWLNSRLFIFTYVLRALKGLRCVVFVETRDEIRQRFLGLARPEDVYLTLGRAYRWFDKALGTAWLTAPVGQELSWLGPLSRDEAERVVNGFIDHGEITRRADDDFLMKSGEWDVFQQQWELLDRSENRWEHTRWLDQQVVNDVLRSAFFDRDASQFVDSLETTPAQRTRAVLRRRAPFVALVNKQGEFKGLVDRQALLERVVTRLDTEAAPEATPAASDS